MLACFRAKSVLVWTGIPKLADGAGIRGAVAVPATETGGKSGSQYVTVAVATVVISAPSLFPFYPQCIHAGALVQPGNLRHLYRLNHAWSRKWSQRVMPLAHGKCGSYRYMLRRDAGAVPDHSGGRVKQLSPATGAKAKLPFRGCYFIVVLSPTFPPAAESRGGYAGDADTVLLKYGPRWVRPHSR